MKIQKQLGGPGGSGWGVRAEVIEKLRFLEKFTKKIGGGGGVGWVRMDVNEELKFFVKIQKKNMGGGRGPGGSGWGNQGGCERRIEVFVKIQKKMGGGVGMGSGEGSGWGVRVDVIEELKFLGKFKKKYCLFFWGGGVGWLGGDREWM